MDDLLYSASVPCFCTVYVHFDFFPYFSYLYTHWTEQPTQREVAGM